MGKRPDIIIFNPDQMRADSLHHLGNPVNVTPFLDSFPDEAVSFSSCFCQNPVCVPSRCSFMTGLYPHVYGHRTMGNLLKEGEKSLLMELKEAGYQVWSNARNDLVSGDVEGLVEAHVTDMFYGGEVPSAPGPANPDIRGKRGDKDFYSFYSGELGRDESGRNYTSDDEDLDAAISFLRNRKDERPLCLFLGLLYPHPPYQVEEPYYSSVDRSLVKPRIKSSETEDKAKILGLIRGYQGIEGKYTEEEWAELRAVYLGMCRKVDDQFRKLCDALKETGVYDNAAVFFFSDHGDYTGDYGLTEKTQNTFEDCLVNVPLLIKPPRGCSLDPGVSDSLVELVDFCATVLDMTGTSPSHDHFGRSLVPVLSDRSLRIRDFVSSEGGRLPHEKHCVEGCDPEEVSWRRNVVYWPRYAAQWDDEAHAKGTMICTDRYKYIHRLGARDEFYDLLSDPGERRNLIDKVEYKDIILGLRLKMLDWYQETADIVPYKIDSRFSHRMVWEKVKLTCPEDHEEEVKEKIRGGMVLFQALEYCKRLSGL